MKSVSFILCIIIFLCACQKQNPEILFTNIPDTTSKNVNYTSNREPLVQSPLIQLPVGSIKPKGWLKTQLERMTKGYTGHLYEISPFLNENSGWLGGEERGWEEAAYWLRGFYDLSVLTGNERIDSVAQRWIEAVIHSAGEEGYYGSAFNRLVVSQNGKDSIADLWPHMVMNDALISHFEATEDDRIIPMLTRFFRFCYDLPDNLFLPLISWDYYEHFGERFGDWRPRIQFKRAGDFIPQIYWLYNHTGDEWLLELALKVYQRTQPPMNQWMDDHVVHFMQRFRYPAQMFPLTGDSFYLDNTNYFYHQMMNTWGQMPRGAFAADERIRNGKIDPRQAFESCGIVEGNKSFYILGNITGNIEYADKVEDLTFNWLPASHAPDLKSLRYLTAANMVFSVPDMDFRNQGNFAVFAASMHRCCQHNTAMGWPGFVKNMWKASPDNGLVAWLYGPNEVQAKVGREGEHIKIISSTSYPFSDQIIFQIGLQESVEFPLYLRIPQWAKETELIINNVRSLIRNQTGRFIKIKRNWKNNDRIILQFNPEITLTEWPRTKSVTINRGPLSFSVHIKENWVKTETDPFGWDKWEVFPGTDWNYGLFVDNLDPDKDIRLEIQEKIPEQPWDEKQVPIILKIPARKITGWKASVRNTVDPLREGPVRSDEITEWIEMIPMGAAHLRLTCLPSVSETRNARYWEDIPDPNVFMLE